MHDGKKNRAKLILYRSELSSEEIEFPSRVSLAANDEAGDLVLLEAVEFMGLLTVASGTLNGSDFW